MFLTGDALSPAMTAGEERMETPGDVAVMLRLAELGWGLKRIAGELGCSRTTVKRYLRQGGWASYRGRGRPSALAGLESWLAERFASTAAMPTWFGRSWRASTGSAFLALVAEGPDIQPKRIAERGDEQVHLDALAADRRPPLAEIDLQLPR